MSNIELYKGDCLEIMDVLIAMGVKVDAIITDPPYGSTDCKWDSIIPFEKMWERLNKLIKNKGAIVLFGSEPFSSALRMSNIKNYKYDWIWDKKLAGAFMTAKYRPLPVYENISVFGNGRIKYNPVMNKGKIRTHQNKTRNQNGEMTECFKGLKSNFIGKTTDLYYPKNIIEIANSNRKEKKHPTQKPVALMEYLIKTYTNEGDTVLDFTMGSGTTGVACVNTNRNFIGIELDVNYFNIAKERIKNDNT